MASHEVPIVHCAQGRGPCGLVPLLNDIAVTYSVAVTSRRSAPRIREAAAGPVEVRVGGSDGSPSASSDQPSRNPARRQASPAERARTGPMRIEEPLPMYPHRAALTVPSVSALESSFPGAAISRLAEVESWRKEIHRPATHTHKWWAQRLGTVFRGVLLAATAADFEDALAAYGAATSLEGLTVFDPFAGSGTTLVEAAKTGASVIGFDINPVATLVQRQALAGWDEGRLRAAYKSVEAACRTEIDELHRDRHGDPVLYYFWVATARCITCEADVELFSTRVFARHAYPRKFPEAQATCPSCHHVVPVDLSRETTGRCASCRSEFSLDGPVSAQTITCPQGHCHRVIDALRKKKPDHRMYAKLVLGQSGKTYQPIDDFDCTLYAEAASRLVARGAALVQPVGELEKGYNTVQAMRWGYRAWLDFFNDRQLYSLGLLATAIRDLDGTEQEREALAALFSGTLEFNNLFCSYKGEGTGAVRHMFSHHVLKPERTPLEAHPWGTTASSGSFSTLFESRLLRGCREILATPSTTPISWVTAESKTQYLVGAC